MIYDFAEAWTWNSIGLRRYFEVSNQSDYDSYQKILYKLIEIVVNPYLKEKAWRGVI